ncbi:hypothetical protein EK21DRAFT_11611, partial [Setomelanomma holmii]
IQYRSYQQEIQVYHYRANFLSVHQLRAYCTLNADRYGFVTTLLGPDTVENNHLKGKDDILPTGSMETGFLTDVFTKWHGCTFGIRVDGKTIEWFVFDRPILDRILNRWWYDAERNEIQRSSNLHPEDPRRLFDFVGISTKGLVQRRVKGANFEHRMWWYSLNQADYR